jgi:two-component system, OmpR family, phosphate regulon sensor histidine kinase PhoR
MRWLYQKRGFLMRALICWVFSLFFLKFDQNGNYDIRFKLRGEQKISQKIVLVTLKASEFSKMYDFKTSTLINTNELSDLSDSFYWDRNLWKDLLSKILEQKPAKVGITLYFGDNVGQLRLSSQETSVFKDSRIVWATNSSEPEKLALPIATKPDKSNIANIDTIRDDDGIVRRLKFTADAIPNIAERMQPGRYVFPRSGLEIINYKGPKFFTEISLSDALSTSLPKDFFKDKIIIIGAEKSINSQIQSPNGLLSRHEYWATVTENIASHSFIKKLSSFIYVGFLLLLTVLAILIITTYPQAVALFFLVWLATLTAAFSAWTFDVFYIWIPIVSPVSLFIFIWVLFIGYQALKIEQAHARLQQQQSSLAELEQLKNNFVSLISHDLKTPIAKIQAVLDRVLTRGPLTPELQADLSSLKDYSEELNRYIQSILKVLRVESRDFKILKETADINGIIENAVTRLSPLARSKKIEISLNLEPMFLIEIDVTLMTEVFLNIIENAIKYTPEQGSVNIRSFETDQEVCIEIADTGEGIALEDQELVWKKFVRGKSQDYKTKGTGLGLYLVKYFIELHGGNIAMKSELKNGTSFLVSLPIEPPETNHDT